MVVVFHIGALFLALGLTPWLLARRISASSESVKILACWGPVMVGLNVLLPVALHLLHIEITATTLAMAHLAAGLVAVAISFPRRNRELILPLRPLLACAAVFALLVIPFTPIAGIDTYKWQDLAGNVAVEGRISWLIHPLSLLGFTPRSYSSAQPLVLATIQIMGHTGVDWGFYILSLGFGLTGLAGAWMLGRRLFETDRLAFWFACFYCFAPVFMRYNYWATGRGLLLALLPIYLLSLLNLARLPRSLFNVPAFLFLSLLLALSHKAGLIGAILIPTLFLASPLLVVLRGRWGLLLGLTGAAAIGLSLAGAPATLAYRLLTRFGWLIPLVAWGLYAAPERFASPAGRAFLAAGLATLAISCTPDMYGALLALPFITFLATTGFATLPARPFAPLAAALAGLTALIIVANQATDSPSNSLYRAAQFLEQHDPRGPYRIVAPGKARAQVQAYVSGCPRFTVNAGTEHDLAVARPPQWTGKPARDARQWIDYLRKMFELRGAGTDWYGSGDKVYTITVGSEGVAPKDATLLFTHGDVKVFGNP